MESKNLKVDIFTELNRIGLAFEYTNNPQWIKVLCPFHNDTNPSCFIHTEDQYFKCQACQAKGSFAALVARRCKENLYIVVSYFEDKYGGAGRKPDKPVETELVERWHNNIWAATPLLQQLYNRGFTNELIRYYRLGEDRGRITIPIPNANKVWVDVLKYSPGAVEKKFTHMQGRGEPRLYPIEQLHYPRILVCGGPLKAAVAAYQLNTNGIGCVSSTGSETSWQKEFDRQLSNKEWLGICFDIDDAGTRAADTLARRLHILTPLLTVLRLPLDRDKYPKGDISDYVGLEKQHLMPLVAVSPKYEPPQIQVASYLHTEPEQVTIQQACKAAYANKRLTFRGLISASEADTFYLPKTIQVQCDKKQDFCGICPIRQIKDDVKPLETEIHPENENLLAMLNAPLKGQHDLIRKGLNIPICKSVQFTTTESYNASQLRITPDLDSFLDFRDTDTNIALDTVSIDCELRLNETYDLTGRIVPHPNTQRATAIISKRSTVVDTLSSYQVNAQQLLKFQPANANVETGIDWSVTGIHGKLTEIYTEFERNVTNINERRDLHLLIDLAYHSVLYFEAEGKSRKGYVEVLIVGDSSQGKSDTFDYMGKYYGLGQKIDMANATVAGVLGGVAEIARRKYISWGIMPANDRRLVCFEELSAAYNKNNIDVLSKIAETRTSGKANIPKIERGTAWARCRLVTLSNILSGREAVAFNYGIEIIRELISNPQDIRRFDACMVINRKDVSENVMQSVGHTANNGELVIPKFDSLSCRSLVLWAWTRTPEQIRFENWPKLLDQAATMAKTYIDSIPIVDRGGIRFKLARLAAALAARTFSCDGEDYNRLLVRESHVDYIFGFLNKLYCAKSFGYDKFSEAVREQSQLVDTEWLIKRIVDLAYPRDFAEFLLRANSFDLRDICDWLAYSDRIEGTRLISDLVRARAIVRDGAYYRKSAPFIELLQELLAKNKLPMRGAVPAYIKGDM